MVVTKVKQIKTVRNLGSAVSYISNEKKILKDFDISSLERAMAYIDNPDKTLAISEGDETVSLFESGKEKQMIASYGIVDPQSATEEFLMTQYLAETRYKGVGRKKEVLAHHIIQSFSPEDNLTPEEVMAIGQKTVLELTGGEHEFVIATHVDKDHLHNHIIVNATNRLTHKQFRWEKKTAQKLFEISNKYADLAGAKVLDRKGVFDHTSYQAYLKKTNHRRDIKEIVNFLMKQSVSLDDFVTKARELDLMVDFSGKEVKYKLLNTNQKRFVRDGTLSKKGAYSKETIEKRLQTNAVVYGLDDIRDQWEALKADKESEFEMRLTVEPWQVEHETRTGIYLKVDYGLRNKGVIKIPYRHVDKLDDGNFELFIKRSDYFYFQNERHSDLNRYMKGETLVRQLSKNNGEYILRKNAHVSKLSQLVKEFDYLSRKGVSSGEQFVLLAEEFKEELNKTEETLGILDERIAYLNKIHSGLVALESSDRLHQEEGRNLLAELGITEDLLPNELEKEILELMAEKQGLEQKLDDIERDYALYQEVKENTETRLETRTR